MNFFQSFSLPLIGREYKEKHRVSTLLELFFDLMYVIAMSALAHGLYHLLVEHQVFFGIRSFFCIFYYLAVMDELYMVFISIR